MQFNQDQKDVKSNRSPSENNILSAVNSTVLADTLTYDKSQRLQEIMEKAHIPGVSIATVSDNKIISDAIGIADIQSKTPVTTDTIFWACSLSKRKHPKIPHPPIRILTYQ